MLATSTHQGRFILSAQTKTGGNKYSQFVNTQLHEK